MEALFECLQQERVKVNFMGLVEWFLGIHLSWHFTSSKVDVHMNQTGFAANLVEQFCRNSWDLTPTATPYQSGGPIDSIVPLLNVDDSPSHLCKMEAFQSLIDSIGWLASVIWPDLAPVHSCLSSHNSKPPQDTCMLPYMLYTTYTPQHMTMVSQEWILFKVLCTFQTHLILKCTTTPSRHLSCISLPLLPIAMHDGVFKWVRPIVMVLCFPFSNTVA
jgi:hypothetical protein